MNIGNYENLENNNDDFIERLSYALILLLFLNLSIILFSYIKRNKSKEGVSTSAEVQNACPTTSEIAKTYEEVYNKQIEPKQKFSGAEIEVISAKITTEYALSKKEDEILKLALENKPRKQIASELYVTEHTVKKHLASIYDKLDVSGRKELLSKAKTFIE